MTTDLTTTNNTDSVNFISTFTAEDRDGKIKLANALANSESLVGVDSFTLTDVIMTPGVRSRTGEVCTNTYLVASDGNVYMTQSSGICRSAQQLISLFGSDFGEGVNVEVVERTLSNGNTLKALKFS